MGPSHLKATFAETMVASPEHLLQVKRVWINNVMIVAGDHERGISENSWVLVVWESAGG